MEIEQLINKIKNGIKGIANYGDNIVSMDIECCECEYSSEIVRLSIVNYSGDVLFDEIIKPNKKIKKSRTKFHGLKLKDINSGKTFEAIR